MKKLTPENEQKIRKHIIRKLARRDKWSKNSYMNVHDVADGIAAHLAGYVSDIIEELAKQEIIAYYKGKECLYLNISKEEVRKILES